MRVPVRPNEDMIAAVQPLVPALRRYARALLRNRDDADDLVQDVLERALMRWHQRRQAASARAWLFTILHNLAMDRLRQRARRAGSEPVEGVPDSQFATPAVQGAGLEQRDILSLVDTLPEEQRSVLLLIGVEELSYADAAAVLDVPQGTIMSRLSRGRERLRRMMDKEEAAMPRPGLRIIS